MDLFYRIRKYTDRLDFNIDENEYVFSYINIMGSVSLIKLKIYITFHKSHAKPWTNVFQIKKNVSGNGHNLISSLSRDEIDSLSTIANT